jgi:DNA-binding MarR family transcriptional regulator
MAKIRPQQDLRNCVCLNLRKAARAVTQLHDAAMQPLGVRATQFSILAALRLVGPVPLSPLAKALVMDRTTLTRDLRPLEKAGYVESAPGADRRVRLLNLTAAGKALVEEGMPIWSGLQDAMYSTLGEQEWGRLLNSLTHVVEATRSHAAAETSS